MQRRVVELILEEKERGKTILLSSHMFEEVERTCDRAAIIREGRIVAIDDISRLKAFQRKGYVVTVAGPEDMERIRGSGLEIRPMDDTRVEIFISEDYNKMFSTLASCRVTGLEEVPQTLEQIFIRFYGKKGN
jgi:ABC-2 type transport system ATP-binding protein